MKCEGGDGGEEFPSIHRKPLCDQELRKDGVSGPRLSCRRGGGVVGSLGCFGGFVGGGGLRVFWGVCWWWGLEKG